MKPFVFKLDPILTLRGIEASNALQVYAVYAQKRKEKEDAYMHSQACISLLGEEIKALRESSTFAHKHNQYMRALDVVKEESNLNLKALRKAKEEEKFYFNIYLKAKQNEEALIKLKEKKEKKHRLMILEQEEKELDDKRFLAMLKL